MSKSKLTISIYIIMAIFVFGLFLGWFMHWRIIHKPYRDKRAMMEVQVSKSYDSLMIVNKFSDYVLNEGKKINEKLNLELIKKANIIYNQKYQSNAKVKADIIYSSYSHSDKLDWFRSKYRPENK